MEKKVTIIFFLITILLIVIFLLWPEAKEPQVCFDGHCFIVELALTQDEQIRGLMFREKLSENRGMLFVFQEEANYSFWMKNTLIPLDIIWLNKEREVVFISKNAQPCPADLCPFISPGKPAQYVLEINSGITDKIGLHLGDKMSF